MSDDDRMSLTTAVSDEDDGESVHNSPYRAKQTTTSGASFNCTGAVRKAGYVFVLISLSSTQVLYYSLLVKVKEVLSSTPRFITYGTRLSAPLDG